RVTLDNTKPSAENAGPQGPLQSAPRAQPGLLRSWLTLRREIPRWQALMFAIICVLVCLGIWWFVTRGEPEERIISYTALPSPRETFVGSPGDEHSPVYELWTARHLPDNIWASLRRVLLGFGLAAVIGIPIGILCGCFFP